MGFETWLVKRAPGCAAIGLKLFNFTFDVLDAMILKSCLQARATLSAAEREAPSFAVSIPRETLNRGATSMLLCPTSTIRKSSTLVQWMACVSRSSRPQELCHPTLWLLTLFSCFGWRRSDGPSGRALAVMHYGRAKEGWGSKPK